MAASPSFKPPRTKTEAENQKSIAAQMSMLRILQAMPVDEAIGVAASYLLHCSYNHPEEFQAVMREPVIREGFTGIPLIEQLRRASQ